MSRVLPDIEKSLVFAGISAIFTSVSTKTTRPYTKYWILNLTDTTLEFSWDGANNVNLTLPSMSGFVSDVSTNAPNDSTKPCYLGSGTQFLVRSTDSVNPTSGRVSINGEYIA